MKVNVSNMPLGTLYKFDDNRYVIALMLYETRNGNYKSKEPSRFTEVYQIDGDGYMSRMASGSLVNNPDVFDFDKNFSIMDYDMDMNINFAVNGGLKETSLEELYKLRDAIARSYEEKNRKY